MSMKSSVKLTSEARRAAIIQAVRRLFAEKGFHGTTTRELAVASGVSEALLFKHFPNKEALYAAMQHSCCQGEASDQVQRLQSLEPSASTLVILIHFLTSKIAGTQVSGDEESVQHRLILRSLADDGDFARVFLQGHATEMIRWIEACLKAAVAAGDAVQGPVRADLGAWFAHHVAVMLRIYLLPETPVVDYKASREKLIEQAVWFILRGLGLKEAVIKRHYNPKALALFAE